MLHLEVITPERRVFEDDVDMVVAPASEGYVGILPHHAPLLALLGTGTLTVRRGGTSSAFRVAGGFLQVVGDSVRAVADRAENS